MKDKDPGKNKLETHDTCTSSNLHITFEGGDVEHIPQEQLNELYEKTHGHTISSDPFAATIQREQAIRGSKRNG